MLLMMSGRVGTATTTAAMGMRVVFSWHGMAILRCAAQIQLELLLAELPQVVLDLLDRVQLEQRMIVRVEELLEHTRVEHEQLVDVQLAQNRFTVSIAAGRCGRYAIRVEHDGAGGVVHERLLAVLHLD